MKRRPTTSRLVRTASTTLLLAALSGSAVGATTVPPDDTTDTSDTSDDSTGTPDDGTGPADETDQSGDVPFAVQPSGPSGPGGRDYFVYTLSPGQVYGDVVSISNLGDARATFAIYATDAFNTRDAGFALLREEEEPVDLGTWIELGAGQYTVEPGTRVDIPFRLEVPSDATPGDHAGAIVAQQIPEEGTDGSGIGFDVRVRIGARVYVRVEGLLSPSLTIEDFRVDYDTPANPFGSSSARIEYVVRNTGNVRLSTVADLEIHGLFGLGRHELPARPIPELLPGSSLEIAESVHGVRPLVRQTTSLEITSAAEGISIERSVSAWTIPWLGVVIPLLVVAAYVGWRRWRTRPQPEAVVAT